MYVVTRITHPEYGAVIHIEREMNGSMSTPFQAVQSGCKEGRLWLEAGAKKVRFLIDDQLLSVKQAEHWAIEEYKTLHKCFVCAKVLYEVLITHKLSCELFCSQECADIDYNEEIEKLKDEEEFECF